MLFPNVFFLLYFLPAALLVYWAVPAAARNVLLFVISLVFYAWGEPLHLVPMLFLIVVNYLIGLRVASTHDNPARKKALLRIAVTLDSAVLLAVLYGPAILNWLFARFDLPPRDFHLPPPVGVSFFTLQAMSYVFEIARGKAPAQRSIINTGLFIALMPTVLAGPILRYTEVATQLRERRMTKEMFGLGFERFIVGLAKVLLLAIPLNHVATDIFTRSAAGNIYHTTPVVLAWLGVLAFGLFYYQAFSGFSDMAIGLGRLFGFTFRENFRYPYMAHTVTEFWNRWNRTLYRWFYVYVFLVMGGARAKKVMVRRVMKPRNNVLRNSFVMWILFGLWHGISWSHLFFGAWCFVFSFFEWVVNLKRKDTRSPLWMIYVLFVVAVSWVFLRSYNFMESMTYLSNMLGVNSNGFRSEFADLLVRENWHVLLAGVIASTPLLHRILAWADRGKGGLRLVVSVCHVLFLVGLTYLCFVALGGSQSIPLFMFYY